MINPVSLFTLVKTPFFIHPDEKAGRQRIRSRCSASAPLLVILLLANCLRANDQLRPSPFIILQDNEKCMLPQPGKVTLFFLPLSPPAAKSEWHYLSALSNCLPQHQLSVYHVVFDSTADAGDLTMILPQSDVFDSTFARATEYATDIVLLVDKSAEPQCTKISAKTDNFRMKIVLSYCLLVRRL
ncbi:hypothetical protein JW998_14300, partial [candidate division KSB1 bacterium]|nr:hypothetical protein [candidate division KSB1 bacterium]